MKICSAINYVFVIFQLILEKLFIIFIVVFSQEKTMFIRRKISGSKNNPIVYLQLAVSKRNEEGKPRQKILCTLGKEDELIDSGVAASMAKKFADLSKELIVLNKKSDSIEDTYLLGPVLVLEKMWKLLGLQKKLEKVKSENNLEFDLARTVKLMIFNRLIDPKSKLGVFEWKKLLYNDDFKDVKLNHLETYSML